MQAKARKSDSRGGTPNTADEPTSSSSYRSRANSCGGVDAGIVSQAPTLSHNQTLETRHSADVLEHMESNSLKLDLEKVVIHCIPLVVGYVLYSFHWLYLFILLPCIHDLPASRMVF